MRKQERMKKALSLLVHGPSKAGKSTLSFTMPTPFLVLDAEGSTKFIKSAGFKSPKALRRIDWDPTTQAPPRHDGSWDVCVVPVLDWTTLDMAFQHLKVSAHDFRGVSLDSITECQRKCKANLGSSSMDQQQWGKLLDAMDKLIRGMRDLTEVKTNPLEVVMLISESRMKDGKWRPYMQGAIETSLPYWVDLCGYLSQEIGADGLKHTHLLATNHPQYEAGERVQGRLPDIILDPNLTSILHTVYA